MNKSGESFRPGAGHAAEAVRSGNAVDAADRRGWLIGHFYEAEDDRSTRALEVKWNVHVAGAERPRWAASRVATTLALLVRGQFVLAFPGQEVVLAREGDYVLWGPGVPHRWRAETEAVVVTVRWPSLPSDSVDVDAPGPPHAANHSNDVPCR